jgi:ABC-type Fe3+ transport system substrate-binding protein
MRRRTASAAACALLALASAVAPVGGVAQAEEMNARLRDLVAAANKEGSLTLSWSTSTYDGPRGAAIFEAAMNKMFGSNVRVNFVPGADMARIGNQLATEYSAGQKASADIMLGAAPQMATLVKADLFEPVQWSSYMPSRIDAGMTEVGGKLIRMATGLTGSTYNSSLAPMTPTTLEDFLKPEWKGKIASTPYAAGFDVLFATDVWGKQRTVDYVEKLSRQVAGLIRCGEAERVATGEYLALVMDCTGQDALQWQAKGAPLAQMMPLDAAQERYYYFGIPKNAQHPSAAKLYTLFILTGEGQKLSYDTWKIDLHTLPGSRMGKTVDDFGKQNVKFKEVTTEWYLQHPEIDASKSELIKIITTKN